MIFILSVCIKWSSDYDNKELFQDIFIIWYYQTNYYKLYKCDHGQRTRWIVHNFEWLLRHIWKNALPTNERIPQMEGIVG